MSTAPATDVINKSVSSILVTGAAGFIGSHAAEALLAKGYAVVGVDNLDPYYSVDIKRRNVREVAEQARRATGTFVFHEGDLRDTATMGRLLDEHSVQSVVHLGALAGVRASIDRPADYASVNVMGTLSLLELAAQRGLEGFVLGSTSSVYGTHTEGEFVETMPCDRPLSPYAATKRSAEVLAHTFHHLHGLPVTCLRFFTVYGPRNRPDMMAYKILQSIHSGAEIPLYDGGDILRDWTFVHDIAFGIAAAVERPMPYEIINLGRGEPVLLSHFLELMESRAGKRARVRHEPRPSADVPFTSAGIEKARRLLAYDPHVSVEEGVRRTCEWFQSRS